MVHVIEKPDLAFHKNDVVPYKGADGTINYLFVTTDIKQEDYVSQQSIAGKILESFNEEYGDESALAFSIKARKKTSAKGSSLFVDPTTGFFLVYPGDPKNGEVFVSRNFYLHLMDIFDSLEDIQNLL